MLDDEEVLECHRWMMVNPLLDHDVYATVLSEDVSHQFKVVVDVFFGF
jgi:phage terminase large subunit-like protein